MILVKLNRKANRIYFGGEGNCTSWINNWEHYKVKHKMCPYLKGHEIWY